MGGMLRTGLVSPPRGLGAVPGVAGRGRPPPSIGSPAPAARRDGPDPDPGLEPSSAGAGEAAAASLRSHRVAQAGDSSAAQPPRCRWMDTLPGSRE